MISLAEFSLPSALQTEWRPQLVFHDNRGVLTTPPPFFF